MTYQAITNLENGYHQAYLPYQDLLDLVLEHTPAAIALVDSQMRYLKVSQRWLKDYGFSEAEIIGKFHYNFFPGLREHWQKIYHHCQTGAIEKWSEYLPQQESGEIHQVKWEAKGWFEPIVDRHHRQNGKKSASHPSMSGLLLFAEKVITCSTNRETLERQLEREHLVRSIAAKIHQSFTLNEILQTTVDEVREFLRTDRVMIYRFHPDWSGLIVVESVNEPSISLLQTTLKDPCFCEKYVHLYQQGRSRGIADIENSGLMQCHVDFLKNLQVRANLVVPILQGENLWGLLIANECKSPRIWQESDINLLKQLASHVAIAIQQQGLYENLQHELNTRHQKELALQQSEAKFKKLAANMPGVIYQFRIAKNGAAFFTFISSGCAKMFGVEAKEIKTNVKLFISMVHPEDRQQFYQAISASMQTLQPWKWEGRIVISTTKEIKWIQAAAQPDRYENDDIVWDGLLMDITAMKQAEAELQKAKEELEIRVQKRTAELSEVVAKLEDEIFARQKSDERLRTVVTNTPIILYALDSEGFFTLSEGKGLESIGLKQGELVGKSIFDLCGDREDILNPIRSVLSGEERIWTMNIKDLIYQNRANPIKNEHGEITGAIGIAIDITYRVQIEETLRQKAQELETSLRQLKSTQSKLIQTEKISSLGQMVAGIAHEVNNPVAFISGNLHIANHYTSDLLEHIQIYQKKYPNSSIEIEDHAEKIDLKFIREDLPKMLSSMVLGTDRIREIMKSLRNFSRVDEAKAKPANLHEGLDSTLMILQHRLKKQPKRPAIQVIKEYGDIPLIECYAGQLNQVFMNIIANAIDALDESNACRTYREIEQNPNIIRIHTQIVNADRVLIRIADNGPGIPETTLPNLFDPFFTTKPVGKGTGLGLSISYQIVTEIHKGQLQCISTPGKGTEFAIEIPISQNIAIF